LNVLNVFKKGKKIKCLSNLPESGEGTKVGPAASRNPARTFSTKSVRGGEQPGWWWLEEGDSWEEETCSSRASSPVSPSAPSWSWAREVASRRASRRMAAEDEDDIFFFFFFFFFFYFFFSSSSNSFKGRARNEAEKISLVT
jgi:hypothetical protein